MNQANICAFFHKTILNYIFGCQLNSLFRTNHPQPIGCAQHQICDKYRDTLVKTQRQKLNNSIVKIDYPKQSNNLNESKISQINAKLTALEVPVFDQKYMLSRRKVQNTQVVSWMGNTKDRQMDKTSETQANLKLRQIGMPVREQLQLPDYNLVASRSNEGPGNIPTSANPYIDRSLIVQSIRKVDQNKFTQTQQNITKNSTQQALQIIPISLFKEPSQLQDEKINEQPDEYPILGLIWQSKIMMK